MQIQHKEIYQHHLYPDERGRFGPFGGKFVTESLMAALAELETAYQHAVEVDTTGRTVVITCERPQAEYARDQIHGYGADPRMPRSNGSMKAVIQPVSAGQS